jgi:hypothetical protein
MAKSESTAGAPARMRRMPDDLVVTFDKDNKLLSVQMGKTLLEKPTGNFRKKPVKLSLRATAAIQILVKPEGEKGCLRYIHSSNCTFFCPPHEGDGKLVITIGGNYQVKGVSAGGKTQTVPTGNMKTKALEGVFQDIIGFEILAGQEAALTCWWIRMPNGIYYRFCV